MAGDVDPAVDEGVEDGVAAVGPAEQGTLVGLEVTATGNVTEAIDTMAFHIDKDGLGQQGQQDATARETEETVADDEGLVDDVDFYDYDYYTDFDEEFGDDRFAEEGVLVLDVKETSVASGDAVQVTGTVRQFEQRQLEDIFGIELQDDLYDPFEEQLVIVADRVTRVPAAAGADAASPTPTEAAQ
ncbi:MAG: hypothetical protein M3N52_12190 [Actinomycetota bacterium]|nr:hypothetical protein [Actinomycetota bacterium]